MNTVILIILSLQRYTFEEEVHIDEIVLIR